MSVSSSRKRLTVIPSVEGIEKAERSLIRLGFGSKTEFAKYQFLSRTVITKFFKREPIQLDTFKRICQALKLDWNEVVDASSKSELSQKQQVRQAYETEARSEAMSAVNESVKTLACQVTVINKEKEVQAVIILESDNNRSINENLKQTLEVLLKNYAGCTIQITNIESG